MRRRRQDSGRRDYEKDQGLTYEQSIAMNTFGTMEYENAHSELVSESQKWRGLLKG